MIIDLRSDTVTQPTPEMLKAMMAAKVGDDVFAEDPTINQLQEMAAGMFGTEAALFCPSGTMTNQIGLQVLSRPGDEVICHAESHIFWYEGAGLAANSGLQVNPIGHGKTTFSVTEAKAAIRPADDHYPRTSIIAIENTANRGGGACWNQADLVGLQTLVKDNNLKFHIDGARLFNALVAKQEDPKMYGQMFDSISICLSKGLGCPVGSLLLGSSDFIKEAHRIRKRTGGGMRQAGFLAAAGIYALENNIERLADDHAKAAQIGAVLEELPYVKSVLPVDTNIVIFQLTKENSAAEFCDALSKKGIIAMPFGPDKVRFVFHLEITDEMQKELILILQNTTVE